MEARTDDGAAGDGLLGQHDDRRPAGAVAPFTVASLTVPSTSSVKTRLSRASTFALIPCRSVRPVASTSRVTGSWMRSWETSSRNRASCAVIPAPS